ncbi:hypothetical protein [Sphingobacterium gobiense]|uniref:Uncharacterized protein n=1 Tax=Sphingobacterium gobiense TaxID=1382456 RepID=A0A2S9JU62_9SPHI|nr:hypothetical protein [Sphingobacterium gobiense]PRD56837.1 hypothetical protein C5749_06345 [Sphingobacterium gobiense]
MNTQKINYQEVKGWGIDADPLNEPTYPMKEGDAEDKITIWERPDQQQASMEVLTSNERATIPAVFGQTIAPQGISGHIRRYAFNHSESRYRHWIPLLIADRINEIEGIIDDFKHGKAPHILLEKGWRARWKLNKKSVMKKAGIGLLLAVTAAVLVKRKPS